MSSTTLGKRSMDPVTYRRINKRSGKEVGMSDLVEESSGEDGRFLLLSPEQLETAYP